MEQSSDLTEARDAVLALDFTWTGLRRKHANWPWAASGEPIQAESGDARYATLQDFWRAEEDRLVETELGTFTRWHLPPGIVPEASPSHAEFSALIERAIFLAGVRPTTQPDVALPLSGVRFPSGSAFAGLIEQAAAAGISISLRGASVIGDVSLSGLHMESPLELSGMRFLGQFEMSDSSLPQILAENARFSGKFVLDHLGVDAAVFTSSIFSQPTAILECQFGRFSCRNARFVDSAWFQSCSFHGNVDLSDGQYGDVTFKYCNLPQLDLLNCQIGDKLWILQNDIKSIYAYNIYCGGEVYLDARKGNERIWFNSADIRGPFHFAAAVVTQEIDLNETIFYSKANFSLLIAERAVFSKAQFLSHVSFRGATFNGPAAFDDVRWPTTVRDYASAFRDARFSDAADFTGKDFAIIAAFNEAHFSRPPLLNLEEGQAGEARFRRILRSVAEAAEEAAGPGEIGEARLYACEIYYGALEGGSRVLKHAMEARRARSLEQRLYRYELIARRHRPTISSWERSLSWLYGASSNYGESSLRPLLILLGITMLLGLAYAAWAAALSGTDIRPLVPQGLMLSGRNVFRPFEVWSTSKPGTQSPLEAILMNEDGYLPLLTRLVSSGQTFVSFMLTFLVGLALKRKFQLG